MHTVKHKCVETLLKGLKDDYVDLITAGVICLYCFNFHRVRDFEYTPECIIFDLLNIPLYHGWLVDPQSQETVTALGCLGYNQIVEKIILNKCSSEIDLVTEGKQLYICV